MDVSAYRVVARTASSRRALMLENDPMPKRVLWQLGRSTTQSKLESTVSKESMQEAKRWVNWSNLGGDTPRGSLSEKLVFQPGTSFANPIRASRFICLHKQAV
jgi:hypothetical protein